MEKRRSDLYESCIFKAAEMAAKEFFDLNEHEPFCYAQQKGREFEMLVKLFISVYQGNKEEKEI